MSTKQPLEITMGTHNLGKLKEINTYLENSYLNGEVILKPLPEGVEDFDESTLIIPEGTAPTVATRMISEKKAEYYAGKVDGYVLSDDSGIAVVALGDVPGYKARRWSEETNENLGDKIIRCMEGKEDRRACIFTSIAIAKKSRETRCSTFSDVGEIGYENVAPADLHSGWRGVFLVDRPNKTPISFWNLPVKDKFSVRYNPRIAAFEYVIKCLLDPLPF